MGAFENLQDCVGFQWDRGNAGKSIEKHDVSDSEAEEVFFNDPLAIGDDEAHSKVETRGYALGQTNLGRLLFVVFTVRRSLIRVTSAREMTPSERKRYRV